MDVGEVEPRAGEARQDEQLARHVLAREIVAHVGLGEAARARLGERRAERSALPQPVKQERERAGEQPLDAQHAIAGRDLVGERAHDRQAGAHRRLVVEPAGPADRLRVEQSLPRACGAASGFLFAVTTSTPAASSSA